MRPVDPKRLPVVVEPEHDCTCPERTAELHPCAYTEELGANLTQPMECHCCPNCERQCYQEV